MAALHSCPLIPRNFTEPFLPVILARTRYIALSTVTHIQRDCLLFPVLARSRARSTFHSPFVNVAHTHHIYIGAHATWTFMCIYIYIWVLRNPAGFCQWMHAYISSDRRRLLQWSADDSTSTWIAFYDLIGAHMHYSIIAVWFFLFFSPHAPEFEEYFGRFLV